MHSAREHRYMFPALIVILALVVMVACVDRERDPDAPSGTGPGTPFSEFRTPSPAPTVASSPTPTPQLPVDYGLEGKPRVGGDPGTPGARLTPLVTPEGTFTLPEDVEDPEPQGTGTLQPPTRVAGTPGVATPGPAGGGLFPSVRAQLPNLENYTLTFDGEFSYNAEMEVEASKMSLRYEQSAPGTFHLLSTNSVVVEIWSVNGTMWIRDSEGIKEAPEGFAESFDVTTYLTHLPQIERLSRAEEVGEEVIEGRTTTHYRVSAEDAVQVLPYVDPIRVKGPDGSMDIWLDEADQLVLRMIVDLTWVEVQEDESYSRSTYNISAIGETEDIEPPI